MSFCFIVLYTMIFVLFIIWFVLLLKGADILVDGSSSLAKRWKVPAIVIGLTIVSIGTSMPELVVNLFASVSNNTDIAIGNVLGSNIANVLLILWISAIIYPLTTKRNTTRYQIPFALMASLVLGFMANDLVIDNNTVFSWLSRIDGIVLLFFFIIFMVYVFSIAKEKDIEELSDTNEIKKISIKKSVLFIVLWIWGLALGWKWIVDGAVYIATLFGISQSIIWLTIVAVWTSLPELATSVVAARKKESDIAIGNIVGSNIFNIFWILWISAIIQPLPFNQLMNYDALFVIWVSALLFIFLFIGKKYVIQRWQWVWFILLYIIYLIFLIFNA